MKSRRKDFHDSDSDSDVKNKRTEKQGEDQDQDIVNPQAFPKPTYPHEEQHHAMTIDVNSEELDEHTVAYYSRVEDFLNDEFENSSSEHRELFFNNVFDQLVTESQAISKHKITSHIVEKLMNSASVRNLTNFISSLQNEWQSVTKDKFASHVTQAVLNRTFTLVYSNTDLEVDFISELAAMFMDNIEEHISDVYSSHVLSTLLELLGGLKMAEKLTRSRMSREVRVQKRTCSANTSSQLKITEPPELFSQTLKRLAKRIIKSEKLDEFVRCPSANSVLQTLFLVLKSTMTSDCDKYSRRLVSKKGLFAACDQVDVAEEGAASVPLPTLVVDATASHLADVLIRILPDDLLADLHVSWAEKYLTMAMHPVANFVLQKFLDRVNADQFDQIYDALKNHVEDFLARNHVGLVVKMAECANRHGIKQKSLLKHVFQAFHCQKPPERQIRCVPLIVSLTAYDVAYRDEGDAESDVSNILDYNLHGSLLLQQLFRFADAQSLVASFLALSTAQILQMALHPIGSHVVEVFVQSESIDEQKKDQFFSQFENRYVDLACHRTGSRTFDTLWSKATLKQKALITENLAKTASKLNSDRFGQFVYKKCALKQFTERRGEWENVIMGQVKRSRLFDDIVTPIRPEKRPRHVSLDVQTESDRPIVRTSAKQKPSTAGSQPGQSVKVSESREIGEKSLQRPCAKKRRRLKKMGLWNNQSAAS